MVVGKRIHDLTTNQARAFALSCDLPAAKNCVDFAGEVPINAQKRDFAFSRVSRTDATRTTRLFGHKHTKSLSRGRIKSFDHAVQWLGDVIEPKRKSVLLRGCYVE